MVAYSFRISSYAHNANGPSPSIMCKLILQKVLLRQLQQLISFSAVHSSQDHSRFALV